MFRVRLFPPQLGLQGDVQHGRRQRDVVADHPGAEPSPGGAGQVLLGLRGLQEDWGAALASQEPLLLPAGHRAVLHLVPAVLRPREVEVEERRGQQASAEGELGIRDLQRRHGQQQQCEEHCRQHSRQQGVLGGEIYITENIVIIVISCHLL